MSLQTKISAARRLIAEYKKVADDGKKIYTSSLRNTQIEALEDGLTTQSKLPSGQFLEAQVQPLAAIISSSNKNLVCWHYSVL
jgi:multidrug resistance efflux pump